MESEDRSIEELLLGLPEAKDKIRCPNCGAVCIDHKLIGQTQPEFIHAPDPHYSWTELHKCSQCETLYRVDNGT